MEKVMEISGMPEQGPEISIETLVEEQKHPDDVLQTETMQEKSIQDEDVQETEPNKATETAITTAAAAEAEETKNIEEIVQEMNTLLQQVDLPSTTIPAAPKKRVEDLKTAIVIITIGQQRWQYERHFIPSIKAYADKHNFDFIQIRDMLDDTLLPRPDDAYMKQTICMQKCLIASQPWAQKYDVIIYMDADILVNVDKAPNILHEYMLGMIGAVDERNMFGNSAYVSHVWKTVAPHLPKTALEYYFKFFPGKETFSKQFNGGLLIFQPTVHADFFKMVYKKYMPQIIAGKDIDGDQAVLNFEANKANLVQYMDERWNRLWNFCWMLYYGFLNEREHRDILRLCLKQIFDTHYFIHFAGGCGWSLL
jgi:hypothetical protein